MGRGHPVTPVMSALQGPRPISVQSRIDQQNLPFSNEVDNIISATQTFDADNFIKEFDFLQGKEVSNSNDLLAQAVKHWVHSPEVALGPNFFFEFFASK